METGGEAGQIFGAWVHKNTSTYGVELHCTCFERGMHVNAREGCEAEWL